MALQTEAQRRRREAARALRERAAASRAVAPDEPVEAAGTRTVWRSRELPSRQTAQAGVPLSEGITSVFLGAVLYIPIALVTGYASWNYPVALVLVVALSYALCSRRVVAGPGFVAVRKFGPYRVAQADAIRSGAIKQTQRGGVLTVRTGDGRTMRLRRVEYSKPDVNIALRELLLSSGRKYDEGVMLQLELPWRAEFGHHRYLLDAVQ